MATYIYDKKEWPKFRWDIKSLSRRLLDLRHRQGRLLGQMEGLWFKLREEAALQALSEEVLKTSEIEGEQLDKSQIRSSIARHLGMDIAGLKPSPRNVDGIVEMMLDATQKYSDRLTKDRLLNWHTMLFPTGRVGLSKIRIGKWRDDRKGPMQVISGPIGRQRVHLQAPAADLLDGEIRRFLVWFNSKEEIDWVLKSGIAHLWFVTLHPFDDGNGRISRAIADMALARSENSPQRFYSMSAQISSERNAYYDILESTQKGTLDITDWLLWYCDCLNRAFLSAENILALVFKKSRFWEKHSSIELNTRQKKMINQLLDGFEGKLTSSKWAKICKVSQDTASRDIEGLIDASILFKNPEGGRSTSYSLSE